MVTQSLELLFDTKIYMYQLKNSHKPAYTGQKIHQQFFAGGHFAIGER